MPIPSDARKTESGAATCAGANFVKNCFIRSFPALNRDRRSWLTSEVAGEERW
jgi:hypothetical protein